MQESTVTGSSRFVAAGSPIDSFCLLSWPIGAPGTLVFKYDGDAPYMGDESFPTRGLLSKVGGVKPWTGIAAWGSGLVDVYFYTSFIWVHTGGVYDVAHWQVLLNGSLVAEETATDPGPGAGWEDSRAVTITGLRVAGGDVISAVLDFTGPDYPDDYFASPSGTGSDTNRLSVAGILSGPLLSLRASVNTTSPL